MRGGYFTVGNFVGSPREGPCNSHAQCRGTSRLLHKPRVPLTVQGRPRQWRCDLMIGARTDMYDAKKHFCGSHMSLSVTVTSSFDSLELMILQCDFNRRKLLIRRFVTFFSCAFCLSSAFSPQAECKALQKRQANKLRLGDGLHDDLAEEFVETTPKLGQKKKAAHPPGPASDEGPRPSQAPGGCLTFDSGGSIFNVEIGGFIFPRTDSRTLSKTTNPQRHRRIKRPTADNCNSTRGPPPESRGPPCPTTVADCARSISRPI